jgi:hypothetical protein
MRILMRFIGDHHGTAFPQAQTVNNQFGSQEKRKEFVWGNQRHARSEFLNSVKTRGRYKGSKNTLDCVPFVK